MSLGRKQRIDNSAWLEAVATIEEAVSRAELDELTAATVADIKATTAGKRAAYAWSAGKDSIVLGKLCEAAGVTDSMIGVCDLEYPAFAVWIEEHKPAGCEVINTHQDSLQLLHRLYAGAVLCQGLRCLLELQCAVDGADPTEKVH